MAASNHRLPAHARLLGKAAGGSLIKTGALTGEECWTSQSLETIGKKEQETSSAW